ncbi:Na+/H+ antiporter subunit A [Streptomyces sp. H10-C2]|uniref:Na+/H+ antiporter subunit A n=1 Tax=unclassified Streptomyces TaxID=2593676 RepID=UPI0024B97F17|nr:MULTISPECIES: Na+/H+ antiporter subunit A [unclassified Streptomyces]MDJ0339981.1 Na+/H+ antiporter subunit A [Streptomyces sp. PH10-H1]MDJ0369382.1 Na+/H+ antiporter subunit A [Streptomyces sp. H10-C2]
MLALIAVHFVLAACAAPLVRWLGRRAFLVLALAPAATAVWAFTQWASVAGGAVRTEHWRWAPALDLGIALRLDALGLLLAVLAGGVGTLVLVYCTGYFTDDEPDLANFAGTLTAFAGAMLGLVLADDLILLYVFWELTTVFSFLLIGHLSAKKANRRSALQALLVTTAGGLAMLVGLLILGRAAGTYRLSELVAHPPPAGGTAVPVALVLVLAGALSKSAIWPFSLWLPGAMAAPTPVSAYLHAAAMVKGGVYLIARLSPAFAAVAPWRGLTLTLGAATMLLGGWRALRENDLKRILAYGTVSQLGFLTALVGAGSRYTALAGATMLLAHALFKAPLFLVVGIVDHATGTRDIRRLGGLARALPLLCVIACVAGASMAGLPPFLGFAAKEASFAALWAGGSADRLTLYATVAGSALTTAYTIRFLYGAFGPATSPAAGQTESAHPSLAHPSASPSPAGGSGSPEGSGGGLPTTAGAAAHEPAQAGGTSQPEGAGLAPGNPAGGGIALWGSTAVLALAGLVLGPGVGWLDPLMSRYAAAFPAQGTPYHLALWHGAGLPLTLSEIAWTTGLGLFAVRNPLVRWGKRLALPSAESAFAQVLWQTERFALQLTGSIQRGSLSVYLGTALLVFSGAETAALFTDRPWDWGGSPHLWDDAAQIAVAAAVAAAGVLCLPTRQRMKAVVLAGTTGYGTGVLFVLQGAPDLALTQFTVETTSIVVFVLVLRRLPPRFPPTPTVWRRAVHAALGIVAGTLAAGLTYLAVAARRHPGAGADLVAATEHDGLKNVVATILVDLRAWDTMGESAVLAVAAVGVTSLVYLRRRAGSLPRAREGDTTAGVWAAGVRTGPHAAPERTWLAAGGTLAPDRRSVVFEVVARLVFHPILVLSLYLLFSAENLPGGGFTAGLVAGLALVVRYLAGGRYELAEAAPVDAGFLLGTGLMVSVGTGLGGLLFGSDVLDGAVFHTRLPLFGEVHLPSSVLFDCGVYLLVLGVVLDVLRSLGAKIDQQIEREEARRKA